MYCNQCGKENKDGIKFCIHCGSPVNFTPLPQQQTPQPAYEQKIKRINNMPVFITIVILAVVALFNIFRMQASISNVKVYNDKLNADIYNSRIAETNSCIYYRGNSEYLYRLDKKTKSVTRISNRDLYPVAASSNAIYVTDNEHHLYKLPDKSSDLEDFKGIRTSGCLAFVLRGNYYYKLYSSGELIQYLNSDQYITRTLSNRYYKASVHLAKAYKNYIYYTLEDKHNASETVYKFMRVSLETGKTEILANDNVIDFGFVNNKVVYKLSNIGLMIMDLDGKNQHELTSVKDTRDSYFNCVFTSKYIYTRISNSLYRYDADGTNEKDLTESLSDHYGFEEINGGLACTDYDNIKLLDYDLNELGEYYPQEY